ncbi:MAG TPA: hypothetical protein VEA15_07305 [Caulobacteraceae bacterium]|nr:hypothetical protein [Caulobacteraceae bacterium]
MKRWIAAGLACAVLAGCGAPASDVDETAAGGPTVDVQDLDAAALDGGQAPAFAPEYPGGEVVTSISATEGGKPGGIFAFRTNDGAAKVLAFYREKALAAGLTAPPVASAEQIFMAQGTAGDVTVTTTPLDGRTHAQVTWSSR